MDKLVFSRESRPVSYDLISYERRLWPPASSLIVEVTLKKRISINEYRMSNIEVRHSIDVCKNKMKAMKKVTGV